MLKIIKNYLKAAFYGDFLYKDYSVYGYELRSNGVSARIYITNQELYDQHVMKEKLKFIRK